METNESTIEKQVIDLVESVLRQKPGSVGIETRIEDIARDSIELFGLVTAFEKAFDLEAEYQDLMRIETVADIVTLLRKKTSQ